MKKLLSLIALAVAITFLFGGCGLFKGSRRRDHLFSSDPSGVAVCKLYEEFVGNRCLPKCQSDEERFGGDLKCYPKCTLPEELALVNGVVVCTEDADEFDCRIHATHAEICTNLGFICDTSTGWCAYSDEEEEEEEEDVDTNEEAKKIYYYLL